MIFVQQWSFQQSMAGGVQHANHHGLSGDVPADAILIPGGMGPAAIGPEAITKFREGGIKTGFQGSSHV
jgi:hypothetical protein